MAETVYALCVLTSILCAVLLTRSWARSRAPLLLWSSICFVGLALNNVLLLLDLVFVPAIDLSLARSLSATLAVGVLVVGLAWARR
jgi:hypothetical protein